MSATLSAPLHIAVHLFPHGTATSTGTIRLASINRAPTTYGPLITHGTAPAPLGVEVLRINGANLDHITTLTQSKERTWHDQLNDPGTASVTLYNRDPDLTLIQPDDLLRFEHYGYAALCMLARDFTHEAIAQEEEAAQVTKISGPGHLAILDKSLVYPERSLTSRPTSEDRHFTWFSPSFDISSWPHAAVMTDQGNSDTASNPLWANKPEEWPDPTASWIWDPSGTTDDAPDGGPYDGLDSFGNPLLRSGLCLARHDFNMPNDGRLIIYATVDDYGILYFDGVPILEEIHDWQRTFTVDVNDVSAGTHTIAMWGENTYQPWNDHNPAGMLCAVYAYRDDGSVGTLLDHTSTDWQLLGYPDVLPGPTPTQVIRIAVEEAQARGELLGVRLMFTDDTDSDGEPVTRVAEAELRDGGITTKVGTDLLTFFAKELAETYVDLWMAPGGLELWAWNRDGRGRQSPVSFERAVNLTTLSHHRQSTMANVLLIRYHGGWTEIRDDASITARGRRTQLLTLGAAQTKDEAERIGREQLAIYADERVAITAGLRPRVSSDRPYPGFLVADHVSVPAYDGTSANERVIGLTITEDENGTVTYVPELKDPILTTQERHEANLKKMADGTVSGTSSVATPVSPSVPAQTPNCCPPVPTK